MSVMSSKNSPLIVILGPTASGKSDLAIKLAQKFNGELICADSRTIYKGMDIGTAKPSKADQEAVKHHMLDIIEPSEQFSAAAFQKRANELIEDIHKRGKLPILVGGTGLYIDAVIFNYKFSAENTERDPINPRHAKPSEGERDTTLKENTLVLGLDIEPELLKQRIEGRMESMFKNGFLDELNVLVNKYGWDAPGLLSTSYRAFKDYLDGQQSLDEAKAQFVLNDLHLAKRQRSWFRRNKYIHWVSTPVEAEQETEQFLENQPKT